MNMSDGLVIPSGNGFPVLEGFTKQIYGRRGTYEHNLKRYFSSQEWTEKCRCAANIEDIPLLSEEQIHQQLRWEDAMQDKARYIQHYAAARGDQCSLLRACGDGRLHQASDHDLEEGRTREALVKCRQCSVEKSKTVPDSKIGDGFYGCGKGLICRKKPTRFLPRPFRGHSRSHSA